MSDFLPFGPGRPWGPHVGLGWPGLGCFHKTANKAQPMVVTLQFQLALEHAVKVYISPSRGVATNVTHLGLKRKDLKLH